MTSRTTDLIAIGIVLVGGLSMGRQVVEWWRDEPPVVTAGVAERGALQWVAAPLELEFGDYPLSVRRETVVGDREAAMAALIDVCGASLASDRPSTLPSNAATDRLLDHISSLAPVAEAQGRWEVYRLEERFSLVLGVRLSRNHDRAEEGETRRVACWGLAAPGTDTTWTLYVFQPPASGATHVATTPDIPLPPEGRRLLALRSADGGGMIGFSGEGLPQEWMRHFDERLMAQGWSPGGGWTSGKSIWSARYERASWFPSSASQVESENPGVTGSESMHDTKQSFENGDPKRSLGSRRTAQVLIEFSRETTGGLMGLIEIVP